MGINISHPEEEVSRPRWHTSVGIASPLLASSKETSPFLWISCNEEHSHGRRCHFLGNPTMKYPTV